MELLTVQQAAKILGLSQRAVYELLDAGKLRRFKPSVTGRSIRLLKADIESYVLSCEVQQAERHETRRKTMPDTTGLDMLRRFGYERSSPLGSN